MTLNDFLGELSGPEAIALLAGLILLGLILWDEFVRPVQTVSWDEPLSKPIDEPVGYYKVSSTSGGVTTETDWRPVHRYRPDDRDALDERAERHERKVTNE